MQSKNSTSKNDVNPRSAPEMDSSVTSPSTTLRICNWEDYQHYKYRRPVWIKLYRQLIDNYDFTRLSDANKWLFIGLLLLAAETDNLIPDDLKWIQRRLFITSKIDLNSLINIQLVERVQLNSVDASRLKAKRPHLSSKSLANGNQNALPEAEGRAKEQKPEDREAEEEERKLHAQAVDQLSVFPIATIQQFLSETKPENKHRNGGLAVRLLRTGEDDHKIRAWLLKKEEAQEQELQREAKARDEEIVHALEIAHELIRKNGPRDHFEHMFLDASLGTLEPVAKQLSNRAKLDLFDQDIVDTVRALKSFQPSANGKEHA